MTRVTARFCPSANEIRCRVVVADDQFVQYETWVGLYVAKREFDNNYCERVVLSVCDKELRFKDYPDGLYELRLFRRDYERIDVAPTTVCVGQPVPVQASVGANGVLRVTFPPAPSPTSGDWVGLFLSSTHSMKRWIEKQPVNREGVVFFDLKRLALDGVERLDGETPVPRRYECRYFKERSVFRTLCSHTFVPSGISEPFSYNEFGLAVTSLPRD